MEKISGVYKITNKITGEFYIGSSKNIKQRWANHRKPSVWKNRPGMLLYQAFQQYGLENFDFEIIEETDDLKNHEQYFIDLLQPTYNAIRAFGCDLNKRHQCYKRYSRSEKRRQYQKQYSKQYYKSEKGHQYKKQYQNRLCEYNGEILTLNALKLKLYRAGIEHPVIEAKKYLIK